jgi:hypothetical protein
MSRMETCWFSIKKVSRAESLPERSYLHFLGKDRVIFTDYMQQGKSMTGDYYRSLLTKLRRKILETHRGKHSKGVWFLQENASAKQ